MLSDLVYVYVELSLETHVLFESVCSETETLYSRSKINFVKLFTSQLEQLSSVFVIVFSVLLHFVIICSEASGMSSVIIKAPRRTPLIINANYIVYMFHFDIFSN